MTHTLHVRIAASLAGVAAVALHLFVFLSISSRMAVWVAVSLIVAAVIMKISAIALTRRHTID